MKKHHFLLIVLTTLFVSACGEKGSSSSNTAQASKEISAGEKIVKQNCKVCHAQGINGAPVIGNKKMWGPRITKGIPALVANASSGVGLMPAKGGNTELTEEQMTLAVTYMVEQVK